MCACDKRNYDILYAKTIWHAKMFLNGIIIMIPVDQILLHWAGLNLWSGSGSQSQVNYNELELQFKSISSNYIGWIWLQAHSYLAWLCEPGSDERSGKESETSESEERALISFTFYSNLTF